MSLFQSLLLIGTKPKNPLEEALMAFLKGTLELERFEVELKKSKVVVLLKEPPGTGGGVRPLVLDGADGRPALCVFTHADRSVALAKRSPEFGHALETDFSWVLDVMPSGFGMLFNPGSVFSTEVVAEGVDELR